MYYSASHYAGTRAGKRRPWTPGALKVLKAASKRASPVRSVANQLRRTEGAVRQKAFQLGLSMGGGRGRKRA